MNRGDTNWKGRESCLASFTCVCILGRIQKHISEADTEKTPLSQKLDDFGQQLSKVNNMSHVISLT